MNNPTNLFVISAPSGAGKTTLVKKLISRNNKLKYSVSYTTRTPRKNEIHGRDYFFVSMNTFNDLKNKKAFIEYANVFENLYATSREQVQNILNKNQHAILEIDWQGAQQVRKSMPQCISIFILPPSQRALRERLTNRATDTKEIIEKRLKEALEDMSHWNEFDYCIINDEFNIAADELAAIFSAENNHNSTKNPILIKKIKKILM